VEGGAVFDPVCGSGTLLIERALLDGGMTLAGLDVSPTAVKMARANVEAAGLSDRIRIRKGNATDPENWPECAEVLANLPFGMRTKHEKADLPALYEAVVKNAADRLCPRGRAVLYTAASRPLRAALQLHKGRLKVERQFEVRSGGLGVHVYVLTARGKERRDRPPL
jgi:23S rRNA G2445 N2-methylase RlmL